MILCKNNKPAKTQKSSFSPLNSVVHWSFKSVVCHQESLTFFWDTVATVPQGWELRAVTLARDLELCWTARDTMVLWQHRWFLVVVSLVAALLRISCLQNTECFLNTFQPVLMTVGLLCNHSVLLRLSWWSIPGKTIIPGRKEVYSNGSPSNQVWAHSLIFYCPALFWIFTVPLLDVQSCLLLFLKYKYVVYDLIFLWVPQQVVCCRFLAIGFVYWRCSTDWLLPLT